MSLGIFDVFAKMIAGLPAQAIPQALDLQCKMLKEDLEQHRLTLKDDASSIMCFRQFVRMMKSGDAMHCVKPLPPDHIEFYKETVLRLLQAGELPQSALEEFDFIFVKGISL
jgi:hypothetical protein